MGIRELRDNLTATIRRVREGASIEITHHEVPVALLHPAIPDRVQRLLAAGDVSAAEPLTAPLRRHRATSARTASAALAEDRAER